MQQIPWCEEHPHVRQQEGTGAPVRVGLCSPPEGGLPMPDHGGSQAVLAPGPAEHLPHQVQLPEGHMDTTAMAAAAW